MAYRTDKKQNAGADNDQKQGRDDGHLYGTEPLLFKAIIHARRPRYSSAKNSIG